MAESRCETETRSSSSLISQTLIECSGSVSPSSIAMVRASARAATKRTSYVESGSEEEEQSISSEAVPTMPSDDDKDEESLDGDSSASEAPRKRQKKEKPSTNKSPAKAPAKSAVKSPAKGKASAPRRETSASSAPPAPPPSMMVPPIAAGSVGIVDITQGPPVTTDSAAKKLVLQYLKQQNRPYSLLQIFDNLHKRIPKATLERVLGVLSAPGEGVIGKEYGKAKIFYPDQSLLASDHTAEQLERMAEENDDLRVQVSAVSSREREMRAELSRLQAEPSDADLPGMLELIEARVSDKCARVAALTASAARPQPGGASLKEAIVRHNRYREAWFQRRSLCNDAIDLLADSLDRRPRDLVTDLGLETDESANVKLPPILKAPPQGQQSSSPRGR